METQTEDQKPGQLIYVPHNDTIRLLEVYVKRSLSLNDGSPGPKSPSRKEKWVARPKKQRRHSSDPSLHYIGIDEENKFQASEDEPPVIEPETVPEMPEKPTKKPKKSKPTFWKSFLGFFSRKSSDETDEEQDSPETTKSEESSETPACLPITPATLQKAPSRKKSLRKRFSKRRLSFSRSKLVKDHNTIDITRVEAGFNVEPTYTYYEKFSEELEKIVHEVKEKEEVQPLSDEEVINRIIELTKQEGDAIDTKLKDNPTLSNFFQSMTYSSFQKLADEYLEKEVSPISNPPTVPPTAPELVKLAFTADFTARIAGLSKQNIGHITGLGNLYLQNIFKYKQACSDHPWDNSDV